MTKHIPPIYFGGGGGGGSAHQQADTLTTDDTLEALIGISEGPIKGPVAGAKSFYADNTALVSANGQPNFSNFTLDFWPGSSTGDVVAMALGGFGSPVNIQQTLSQNEPVVRQGLQTNITAVDFRILIQELYKQNENGIYTDKIQLKFEYSPVTSTNWRPCFAAPVGEGTSPDTPANGANTTWSNSSPWNWLLSTFEGDRQIYGTPSGAPATPPTDPNSLGIDETGNVYQWDTGSLVWYQAETTNGTGNTRTFKETVGNQTYTRTIFFNQNHTPTAKATGDVWDVGGGVFRIWNGSAWVTPAQANANSYLPDYQNLDGGVWSWTGKVTSQTAINIRVFVPAISDNYQYRVTKLTTDNTETEFSVVQWDAVQEIKQTGWKFFNLAMMRVLGQATDQFTAIPQFGIDAEGRIVKVPSNYDPVARTYSGVWDGTYKLEYTNNPAFILQDFVENTSYGLSSVYPHTVNPWSFYNWGVYCDEPVPTAAGGTQPRWTYNDWITQPRDAMEMAQYIAGAAAAIYIDDGNGNVDVIWDDNQGAVALFTPENVTPDGFSYSYTDRLTRPNNTLVSFVNPDVNWQVDKRRVYSSDDIETYGLITEDFIAVGCTNADEALRRARRRLVSSLTEKEMVVFTTNRKGKYLSVWNVILVADPNMGRGVTGRVMSVIDDHTVQLRDPITLEAGFSYQAVFDIVNPYYPAQSSDPFNQVVLDITTPAGSVTQLTFAQTLGPLPDFAAFSLQCPSTVGAPKPYRILAIEDDSGSGELVRITALELNRNKYAFIDQSVDLGVPTYSSFDTATIEPPLNLGVIVNTQQVGGLTHRQLTLSYDPSPSQFVQYYRISYSVNGVSQGVIQTKGLTFTCNQTNTGIYAFTVQAVNFNGKASTPVVFTFDTTGEARPIPGPTDIALLHSTTATTFDTNDATFVWNPAPLDPNFAYYQVQVLNGATVLRTVNVGNALKYTYDFNSNFIDNSGTPLRTFTVQVSAVDQHGNVSDWSAITVSNPPPALSSATLTPSANALHLTFTPPTDLDYSGVMVWMSTTNGFTPSGATLVYNDLGNPTLPVQPSTTYYLHYAFFDTFGQTGLNMSAQMQVTTPAVTVTGLGTGATLNVTYSNTAPTTHQVHDVWVNTSVTPNIWQSWSGSAWVAATPTNTNQLTDGAGLGQTAHWGSVSNVPGNLAGLNGSEPILNTGITIGSNGALNGAGGGQVTLSGLGGLSSTPGAVLTQNIASGAVSNIVTASQIGSASAENSNGTGQWVPLASVSINCQGGPVIVNLSFLYDSQSWNVPGQVTVAAVIARDSTQLFYNNFMSEYQRSNGFGQLFADCFFGLIDNPGAGSHTYYLYGVVNNPNNSQTHGQFSAGYMSTMELKR